MPSLSLSNNLLKSKSRNPKLYLNENFKGSGTGSFNVIGSNASIANDAAGALTVTASATNGYAKRTLTVRGSTKYYLRIKLVGSSSGSGDKTVMIGTSGGDDSLLSLSTPGVAGTTTNTYYNGAFTTGGSTTTIYIGLKVQTDTENATWDDILIETWDDE